MKTLIMTMALLSALVGLAQDMPSGTSWPSPASQPYTNDIVKVDYCAYDKYYGVYYPAVGVRINFTTASTLKSGWHSHETNLNRRPLPIAQGPTSVVTGSNGCTPSVRFELPGIAGWYTIEAQSQNSPGYVSYPLKGISSYASNVDWVQNRNPQAKPYKDLSRFWGDPEYSSFGDPYNHTDGDHVVGTARATQYVNEAADQQLRMAASAYRVNARNLPIQPITGNVWDVSRCSLPVGGMFDMTDRAGWSPVGNVGAQEWTTRISEEHAWGAECDISNPKIISDDRWPIFVSALSANSCRPGTLAPDGYAVDNAWWSTKDYVHVTCTQAPVRRMPR